MKKILSILLILPIVTSIALATSSNIEFCKKQPTSPICNINDVAIINDIATSSLNYKQAIKEFMEYGKKATEYYEDLAAGSAALSAIDFGNTSKGTTEGGIGIGHASSFSGQSIVGAFGLKHGLTDTNAIIIKGWIANSNAYTVGSAITHRF